MAFGFRRDKEPTVCEADGKAQSAGLRVHENLQEQERLKYMKTIAVIEDDIYIGNLLTESLEAESYHVIRAWSGTEALLLLEKEHPDLILLDLMLPGLNGEQLLPRIKETPVIIVSAKACIDDKVYLLLEGAADYITKPFEMKELLARITVQLRRGFIEQVSVLSTGNLKLNIDTRELLVNKIPVHLTRTEFALLKKLMQNQGHPVSKSALLEDISLDTPDCTESSLKIHISNLRKKLKDADDRDYIESVWGIAVALSGNPDFLVLDEPANGLDPQGIIEMRELILKLNREQGITVLISSHILDELSRLATHYGFIDKGTILREISAVDLEAACRKCLCVTVSDVQTLCTVLDDKEIKYHVLSDNQAEIYGSITVTELVESLSARGCVLSAIHEREEGLENYYMNLIGGMGNE